MRGLVGRQQGSGAPTGAATIRAALAAKRRPGLRENCSKPCRGASMQPWMLVCVSTQNPNGVALTDAWSPPRPVRDAPLGLGIRVACRPRGCTTRVAPPRADIGPPPVGAGATDSWNRLSGSWVCATRTTGGIDRQCNTISAPKRPPCHRSVTPELTRQAWRHRSRRTIPGGSPGPSHTVAGKSPAHNAWTVRGLTAPVCCVPATTGHSREPPDRRR